MLLVVLVYEPHLQIMHWQLPLFYSTKKVHIGGQRGYEGAMSAGSHQALLRASAQDASLRQGEKKLPRRPRTHLLSLFAPPVNVSSVLLMNGENAAVSPE